LLGSGRATFIEQKKQILPITSLLLYFYIAAGISKVQKWLDWDGMGFLVTCFHAPARGFLSAEMNLSSFRLRDFVGTTVGSAVSDVARLPTPRGPAHAAGHARVDPARARALPDVRVLLLEGRQRREVAERARQGLVREALRVVHL